MTQNCFTIILKINFINQVTQKEMTLQMVQVCQFLLCTTSRFLIAAECVFVACLLREKQMKEETQ